MAAFNGFSPKCIDFFTELSVNNNKVWFEEHRNDYQDYVLTPSQEFVAAMGEELKKLRPEIQADPRVNKSLFRIFRDVRFSRDKTPYKTHLAVWFWEGPRPRMECPGFYLHLEPGLLMLGSGIYAFPRDILDSYRKAAADSRTGAALAKALKKVRDSGPYTVGGRHYKRTPRGFDPASPNADLLLHNGLYLSVDLPEAEAFSDGLVEFSLEHFRNMTPLHEWLLQII